MAAARHSQLAATAARSPSPEHAHAVPSHAPLACGGSAGHGGVRDASSERPLSEFIKRVKHDDVQSVAVDGLHISFSLKPTSLGLPGKLCWLLLSPDGFSFCYGKH